MGSPGYCGVARPRSVEPIVGQRLTPDEVTGLNPIGVRPLRRRGLTPIGFNRRGARPDGCLAPANPANPRPGGPSWVENEVAACYRCKADRGHRTLGHWVAECEQRGWEPDRVMVVDRLLALEATIEQRGGQRRARRWIEAQLRRLSAGPKSNY